MDMQEEYTVGQAPPYDFAMTSLRWRGSLDGWDSTLRTFAALMED